MKSPRSYVHFFKPTTPPPPILVIPAKEKPKVLKVLQDIEELFGPDGSNWIQGDEKSTREVDNKTFDTFCLVGALKEIDGPYENAARAAISLAILERDKKLKADKYADSGEEYDDVADQLDESDDTIMDFNDRGKRSRWSQVQAVLGRAKQLIQTAVTKPPKRGAYA